MKNNFKKIICFISCLIILSLSLCIGANADNGVTDFNLNVAQNEGKYMLNVTTDTLSGVGGIDMALSVDPAIWEIKESTVKSALSGGELVATENEIRVLWDTTEQVPFPEVIFSAELEFLGSGDICTGMSLTINDYYDNTISLGDLGYEVNYMQLEKVDAVKSNWFQAVLWVLLAVVVLIIALVAVYCILQNKKIEKIAKNFVRV